MERRQLFKAVALATAGLAAPATVSAQPARRQGGERPDLFVRDWGEGPVLLFLHGWGLASDSWNYVMQPLVERGFRCVSYDMRGHAARPTRAAATSSTRWPTISPASSPPAACAT